MISKVFVLFIIVFILSIVNGYKLTLDFEFPNPKSSLLFTVKNPFYDNGVIYTYDKNELNIKQVDTLGTISHFVGKSKNKEDFCSDLEIKMSNLNDLKFLSTNELIYSSSEGLYKINLTSGCSYEKIDGSNISGFDIYKKDIYYADISHNLIKKYSNGKISTLSLYLNDAQEFILGESLADTLVIHPNTISIGEDGIMVIGTSELLLKYDIARNKLTRVTNGFECENIQEYNIKKVFYDAKNKNVLYSDDSSLKYFDINRPCSVKDTRKAVTSFSKAFNSIYVQEVDEESIQISSLKLLSIPSKFNKLNTAPTLFNIMTASPTQYTSSPTQYTSSPTQYTSSPTVEVNSVPTYAPSSAPTYAPSSAPTEVPTFAPTAVPTFTPTAAPTSSPTIAPTYYFPINPQTDNQVFSFFGSLSLTSLPYSVYKTQKDLIKQSIFQTFQNLSNIKQQSVIKRFQDTSSEPTVKSLKCGPDSTNTYTVCEFYVVVSDLETIQQTYKYAKSPDFIADLNDNIVTIATDLGIEPDVITLFIAESFDSVIVTELPGDDKQDLTDGSIAGIVIGSILGFFIVITGIYFIIKKIRASNENQDVYDANTSDVVIEFSENQDNI